MNGLSNKKENREESETRAIEEQAVELLLGGTEWSKIRLLLLDRRQRQDDDGVEQEDFAQLCLALRLSISVERGAFRKQVVQRAFQGSGLARDGTVGVGSLLRRK